MKVAFSDVLSHPPLLVLFFLSVFPLLPSFLLLRKLPFLILSAPEQMLPDLRGLDVPM